MTCLSYLLECARPSSDTYALHVQFAGCRYERCYAGKTGNRLQAMRQLGNTTKQVIGQMIYGMNPKQEPENKTKKAGIVSPVLGPPLVAYNPVRMGQISKRREDLTA